MKISRIIICGKSSENPKMLSPILQETLEYSSFVPVKGGAGSILLPLPCFVRSDNEQTRLKPPFDD